MNDQELDAAIASQPYPKVTVESIEDRIVDEEYLVLGNSTVTICNLTLNNGFSVRGESACVDKRNFNMDIGKQLARKDAFSKLWQLEGYLLAERKYQAYLQS